MKKRILLILVFPLMLISAIEAKQRTKDEIQAIAIKAINKGTPLYTRSEHSLQELYATSMLSMLGTPEGDYVIITCDDRYPEVVGYSTASTIGELPDGLVWWMNAMTRTMESNTICSPATTILQSRNAAFAEVVEPLITSMWNQNNPFNYMCPPTATKGNYPTGCVATALSQIMHYHHYPERGQGSYTYVFRPSDGTAYQLTANFGETLYDWENMLDSYKSGYSDIQRDAVATIMSHCGISVNMSYNPSGSGAYSVEATNALRNYFRYNKSARLYRREFYSSTQWMTILFTELNNQRPVYYTGVDPNNGGHAFVIDGYDANGLVHVNWGWGGSGDGYYDIALLNPPSHKFSDGQEMVGFICKPDIDIPYASQLGAYNININIYGSTSKRLTMSASVYDIGADDFEGVIAAILQSDDTLIVAKVQENVSLKAASLGFLKYADVSLRSIDLTDIPDGTYRVYLGSCSEEDLSWQLIRPYKGGITCCLLKKAGSDITSEDSYDDEWTMDTRINAIRSDGRSSNFVYDLLGRKQSTRPEALPKGIYIISGRKVMK